MKAFPLTNAPHLPLTGQSHPLVRESTRWLTAGNAVTLFGALAIFVAAYTWSQLRTQEATTVDMTIPVVDFSDFQPQQIAPRTTSDSSAKPLVSPDDLGVPDPVADSETSNEDFPTQDEWSTFLNGEGTGVFDGPVDVSNTPAAIDTFVAFDELPVLLGIGEPVYPEMAKAAGIDGTVLVKVLVTKLGKVKHAVAVAGPEPLREAAVDGAKTATFTPAMQGKNAVEVWVMIPVTFSLTR